LKVWAALVVVALVWFAAVAGCSLGRTTEPEVASSSPEVHADYEVFALRCSKCHSLARPLNSGIDDDDYWRMYVAKMRRMPGSGITEQDEIVILRFLHVFSMDERRRKGKSKDLPEVPVPEADASPPMGPP
jgi:hypothetical protein